MSLDVNKYIEIYFFYTSNVLALLNNQFLILFQLAPTHSLIDIQKTYGNMIFRKTKGGWEGDYCNY